MGAFDAIPGWPPRTHSHLEADGAFALYECWVRLMAGESPAALVCAFSRPRAEDATAVLGLQLDPYVVAPLDARVASIAALQARAMVDSGRFSETDFASVVSARRGGVDVEYLLRQPYVASPLRSLDGSTICSGAAAVVLAVEEVANGTVAAAGVDRRDPTSDRAPLPRRPRPVHLFFSPIHLRSVAPERPERRRPGGPCPLQPSGASRRGLPAGRRGTARQSLGGSPSGRPHHGDRSPPYRLGRGSGHARCGPSSRGTRHQRTLPAAQPGLPDGVGLVVTQR